MIATFIGFAIGALGLYAWMRERGLSYGALPAAAFYTVAPYHLYIDVYHRGAFAETFAFAWAPWLFYGVGRIARRKAEGLAVLAVATALLLTTHLPTSLGLLPAAALYVLLLHGSRENVRFLLLAAFAMLCGALLAGGYLGTALTQTGFINAEALFGARSESWRWLIGWNVWPDTGTQKAILLVAFFQFAAMGLALWFAGRRAGRLFWFCLIVGGGTALLTTSLSAPFWWLETPLNRMQFPWRLLALQTLAAACAIGLAAERLPKAFGARRLFIGIFALAVLAPSFLLLAYRDLVVRPVPLDPARYGRYDAPEYRLGDIDALAAAFPGGARAAVAQGAGTVAVEGWTSRHIRLNVDTQAPLTLAVRQFNYTGWHVRIDGTDAGVTAGEPGAAVAVAVPEAGRHLVELDLVPTRAEAAGWWATLAGLLLLALAELVFAARVRRALPSPALARG